MGPFEQFWHDLRVSDEVELIVNHLLALARVFTVSERSNDSPPLHLIDLLLAPCMWQAKLS
jgi:hypothetical protein